jgi:hypothetical protein
MSEIIDLSKFDLPKEKDDFEIPTIFLDKYRKELSDNAFRVLLKLHFIFVLEFVESDIISISVDHKQFTEMILDGLEPIEIADVWIELSYLNLIKIENGNYYLNLCKLELDHCQLFKLDMHYSSKFYYFCFEIFNKPKENSEINSNVMEYIKDFISKFDILIQDKLKILCNYAINYYTQKKVKINFSIVRNILMPFIELTDEAINQICDIYNRKCYLEDEIPHPNYYKVIIHRLNTENYEKLKKIKQDNLLRFAEAYEERINNGEEV